MVYPSTGLMMSGRYQRAVLLAPQLHLVARYTSRPSGTRRPLYQSPPTRSNPNGCQSNGRACTCQDWRYEQPQACKHILAVRMREKELAALLD